MNYYMINRFNKKIVSSKKRKNSFITIELIQLLIFGMLIHFLTTTGVNHILQFIVFLSCILLMIISYKIKK